MDWLVAEWLVALALTLFIVDFFFCTEVLSWLGVLLTASWITWRIGAPLKWSVLVFVGSFVTCLFLYVFLLRNTIGALVRNLLQGKAPKETLHAIVGKTGVIRVIDNRRFAFIEGELWPIVDTDHFTEGQKVEVTSMQGGEALVIPV